jgi:hypothetical protein
VRASLASTVSVLVVTIAATLVPCGAQASARCTLSNFVMDAYDHGGTCLRGGLIE